MLGVTVYGVKLRFAAAHVRGQRAWRCQCRSEFHHGLVMRAELPPSVAGLQAQVWVECRQATKRTRTRPGPVATVGEHQRKPTDTANRAALKQVGALRSSRWTLGEQRRESSRRWPRPSGSQENRLSAQRVAAGLSPRPSGGSTFLRCTPTPPGGLGDDVQQQLPENVHRR